MAHRSMPMRGALAAELAEALPPFDPFASPSRRREERRLFALSLLIHFGLFLLLGNLLLGQVIEQEEVVIVRMLEPEKPVPEPRKQRRKVLAQRRIDASVTRFTELAQPEVRQLKPVPVLDQARKVEVDPTQVTEAPKRVERREVETRKVSVFAEVETHAQPIKVDRINPEVRKIQAARASGGPRRLEASGPVTSAQPVELPAPVVTRGELSANAIDGTTDGPRIAALEAGVSDRMLDGRGERGRIGGIEKECASDPVCQAYLEMIKERVYSRWHTPPEVASGRAILSFRVDRGGSAHGIKLKHIDDPALAESCLAAFRHASPFPPPPPEILYLTQHSIAATFLYGN
ncbi:MAG: hypothetical protein ACE5FG_15165 [Myxococcota bacterium]